MRPKRKRPPKGYYRNIRILERFKKQLNKKCRQYTCDPIDYAGELHAWRLHAMNALMEHALTMIENGECVK